MAFLLDDGRNGAAIGLMLAAAALYVACRAAIGAIAQPDGSDPGRRAIAQWLPIAATAVAAVLMHQPQIAVTVIFSSSVAAMALALGLSTYLAPMHAAPPRGRAWPFLLPVALLSFVAGFAGRLNGYSAVMLLLLGVAVLQVWLEGDAPAAPAGYSARAELKWDLLRIVQVILALAVAGIGAWGAVQGTVGVTDQSTLNTGVIAATILSPLLVLPSLGTAASVAQRTDSGPAASALIGTVLLNLCLLLPVAIALHAGVTFVAGLHRLATTQPAIGTNYLSPAEALPFPTAVWRIENVILLILGTLLLPVALGRWLLGRAESILLILGYAIYLAMGALASKLA